MTGRLKLIAAALGLVLATGTIANASAQTSTPTKTVETTTVAKHGAVTKTIHVTASHRGHRMTIAHLRALRRPHLAKLHHGPRAVKAAMDGKAVIHADVVKPHRERHAMNHRVTGKPVSVIR